MLVSEIHVKLTAHNNNNNQLQRRVIACYQSSLSRWRLSRCSLLNYCRITVQMAEPLRLSLQSLTQPNARIITILFTLQQSILLSSVYIQARHPFCVFDLLLLLDVFHRFL